MTACRYLVVLWIACGLSAAGRAQVEIRAEERERELSRIEVPETPIARHLISDQRLAVWLPEGFAPRDGAGPATLVRSVDGAMVHFSRRASPPGASLIQVMEATLGELRRAGMLGEVESVRRWRLASRHAIEVTGDSEVEGRAGALRLVLAMDPSGGHHRLILVRKPAGDGEPIDVLFSRLIRDWNPLDESAWSYAFERLRGSLAPEGPSEAWARRNRLFDEIARPDAIGQPWVGERLSALAETDPGLLLDGLLHPHPRVRIACVEVLEPSALAGPARSRLFAIAVQDPDPAVRYRVARRVAGAPELALETLGRVLETDSDEARAAAFQLLAALAPPERASAVLAAFGELRQYPAKSRSFLTTLLTRWGREEEATLALDRAWKTSRDETLRQAAFRQLLDLGHGEALAAARERLLQPLEADPLELPRAARSLAVHACTRPETERKAWSSWWRRSTRP